MKKWESVQCDGYVKIKQANGAELGYSPKSGLKLIEKDGCLFKDFLKNGELAKYADWRLPAKERAEDLASRLSMEDIAGLMLYSNHQAVPAVSYDVSPYNGRDYASSGAHPWDLSDHQKNFLLNDRLRHILITIIESPEVAARWNNEVQAFVENIGFGIPANNSSDPRHSARADAEFNAGGGGVISMWPGPLGLTATFSPETVYEFGRIASKEYRALGFTTALSPQVDICTEPRWYRCHGAMGVDPYLAADLARAYCDGFQTSEGDREIADGWGLDSVNAMAKHWPGGGPCESGRDAHYGFGKYAVYPGNNFELHKIPFVNGAFNLKGKTKQASAVMPYYTIATDQTSENVANAYNKEIITGQLREKCGYDGVICTDWVVTADEKHPGIHSGKPWGVEKLSVAERHYRALMAGVDQFGGNNDIRPVMEAFEMGVREHGREWMEARMRLSARRLLLNIFRLGLFENPYINPEETKRFVGCAELMKKGYEAQLKSVVMLKNKNAILPLKKRMKAYIPSRHRPEYTGFWGTTVAEKTFVPVQRLTAEKYFDIADTPEEADIAIVFIDSPMGGKGYDLEAAKRGETGYIPISLQYDDYVAKNARKNSIAGGDPFETFVNRTYLGKKTTTTNKCEMELVRETRRRMGDKPVVLSVNISNPFVPSEIEPYCDAMFLTFDIQNQAVLDMVTGRCEPSALLPVQMPASMDAVEAHQEDTPRDIECYVDSEGNKYDFAFGMNWKGVIRDERVKRYY